MGNLTLNDVIGQTHLISENGPLYKMVHNDSLSSLILYGPPGIGKTTIANILANSCNALTVNLNGATSSKAEYKEASELVRGYDKVVVIIDEIHRLDKVKQDFLLPFLEKDNFIIIGTTTENPYYDVTSAIRSRCIIFELLPISEQELAIKIKSEFAKENFELSDDLIMHLVTICNGDVRQSLNLTKFFVRNYTPDEISIDLLKELFPNNIVHDKSGDNHHNLLSALQKSIRGSDVDAAMHYMARLIIVGDIKSLCRRLIVIGYEDIGNANPQLCARIVSAIDSFERVGMPEGRIVLATLVVDMALSPKSNAAYKMLDTATADIYKYNVTDVNEHIKYNQKDEYKYSPDRVKYMNLLPKSIKDKTYYYSCDASKYEKALHLNYMKRKKGL
ncbi:AAA family ATPase [Mollicutes bacterium LVI A0078]|nr:AAA family ATPase [Mollicutes bacterium LVI A0075]WOO91533.1 AAA family ATPase [Mollicutes bacterium LVI A0078]